MANTPTYMIFDDHDVTDDWNLSVKWKEDVKAFKLGKRIVANAVGAYWLCQGFGNNPVRYPKDLTFQIADIITQREKDYDAFENLFWRSTAGNFSHRPTRLFIS